MIALTTLNSKEKKNVKLAKKRALVKENTASWAAGHTLMTSGVTDLALISCQENPSFDFCNRYTFLLIVLLMKPLSSFHDSMAIAFFKIKNL